MWDTVDRADRQSVDLAERNADLIIDSGCGVIADPRLYAKPESEKVMEGCAVIKAQCEFHSANGSSHFPVCAFFIPYPLPSTVFHVRWFVARVPDDPRRSLPSSCPRLDTRRRRYVSDRRRPTWSLRSLRNQSFPYPEETELAPFSWAAGSLVDGKDQKTAPTEAVGCTIDAGQEPRTVNKGKIEWKKEHIHRRLPAI